MINVIKSKQRHYADHGWLQTYWHFSFSDYHDPKNENWSVLRVFNDDVIQPGQGFGMHPHRDMEIVTYVLDGTLEHKDNQGNHGVVEPGEVQVMSAGKGILHSEFNHSKTDPVHLLQLWIFPRTRGLTPRWEQRKFSETDRRGKLLPVVTGQNGKGAETAPLHIDQDATIYVSSLKAGDNVSHTGAPGRHAYLFVMDGDVTVNGQSLTSGDQARIADEPNLKIAATKDAHLMLLDLP